VTASVSILLPVLNEIDAIDSCLESIERQDYPGPLEIVVADGGSTDGTLQRLADWTDRLPGLRIINNPGKVQSRGANLAAAAATGDILVRLDGHSTYEPDYVSASVRVLTESGAVAAGGHMVPAGDSLLSSAVAAAMTSPLAIGPGRFHRVGEATDADTVYLGAFRRDDFQEAGGYRTFPSGAAEEADLYRRWRDAGRRIRLDPAIRSRYSPRRRWGSLWRQYYAWGAAKAEVLWASGSWPSWRPLGPLGLVVGLVISLVAAPLTPWPLWILLGAWGLVLAGAALPSGRLAMLVFVVAAVMQLAYGAGLVIGILRGPGPTRRALRQ
jgi:glycosyltransferase involved in cell wall biosynthesis